MKLLYFAYRPVALSVYISSPLFTATTMIQ